MPRSYDVLFKSLAEDHPREFLTMLGCLPPGMEARVEPLPRELVVEPLIVDQAWRVQSDQGQWVVHLECQSRYKADVPQRFAWYAAALGAVHRIPVESVLLLLAERYAPAKVPTSYTVSLGSLRITVKFRVVKLWEIDAASVIESRQMDLMPWVTLMRISREAMDRALELMELAGDREGIERAAMLSTLRYTKGSAEVLWLLKRSRNMITHEIMMDSFLYRELWEKAQREAKREARKQARLEARLEAQREVLRVRVEAVREHIRRIASHRFPAIGDLPELDAISDPELLEQLFDGMLIVTDEAVARAALKQASAAI